MSANDPHFGLPVSPDTLALQRLYHWARTMPDRVAFTQPLGGGVVKDITWKEVMDQTRRLAGHLQSLGLPPGSNIALLSKNTAWWLVCDWAIWMAGHVSVPLYPTLAAGTVRQILEHSEAKLLFVGKLDVWAEMQPGVPEGLPMITLPLAPKVPGAATWDEIVAKTAPMTDSPVRPADELCTLIYTSGTTGMPKGARIAHRGIVADAAALGAVQGFGGQPLTVLCYLPLCHVAERAFSTVMHMMTGGVVNYAESIDTVAANLREIAPKVFLGVPRIWEKLQQGILMRMQDATRLQRWAFRRCFESGKALRKIVGQIVTDFERVYPRWISQGKGDTKTTSMTDGDFLSDVERELK